MREIKFYPLNKEYTRIIREQWKETGAPLGNSYYWIQYKDGSVIVFDHSYDEEKLPSLDISKIAYISDWFAAERGGYAEVYINERLLHNTIQEIITDELYDEDGNYVYNKVEVSCDFANWGSYNFD